MFKNRHEAGLRLGEFLEGKIDVDLVLGIARGGIPIAVEVGKILGCDVGAIVSSKVGVPGNPELALGAVTSDGTRYINPDIVSNRNIKEEFIAAEFEKKLEEAVEKMNFFAEKNVNGLNVLIVDDGIATGATAKACLKSMNTQGAEKIFFAAPIGPTNLRLKNADEVFILEDISGAVGASYEDFEQVSIEEARELLTSV